MAAATFVPFNWNLTSRCEGFAPLLLLLLPPLLPTTPAAQRLSV
jgi:hypothetical protein